MHTGAVNHRHKNSQKRIYIRDAVYFITCATYHRIPYFKEKIFCDVFVENLRRSQQLKGFKLYGYFLGYDHFHMLIKPNNKWNYSEIMQSLKRNTSRDINKLINLSAGEVPQPRRYREVLHQIIGENMDSRLQEWAMLLKDNHIPFKWQKSFHDHYIRNERDFCNQLNYIRGNPLKHNMLNNWPYVWIDVEIEPP